MAKKSKTVNEISHEEINDAFTSPLFCEHNFKKLSIIFSTKNILLFSINKSIKFFKFFETFKFEYIKIFIPSTFGIITRRATKKVYLCIKIY